MNHSRSIYAAFSLRFIRLEDRLTPTATTPDAVLRWHEVMMEACTVDNSLNYISDQGGPTRAARAMAIIQGAVFDAVNSIDERYTRYLIDVDEAPGSSIDAAVAQTAHDTLVAMYPKQKATFDAKLIEELAKVDSGRAEGVAVGSQVAAVMLADRANDGSGVSNTYTPGTGPLDWKPDPLHPGQKALTPDWGFVKPFTMNDGSQFRPAPPPDVNSAEYLAAYQEVLRLGGDGVTTPTERTAEQTEIGIFWGYDGQPGLCTPPRLFNQIAHQIAVERGNTLVQNARLFALLNFAQADAGVSAWEAKFFYNFARPVTAIREAALDGNPLTTADPNWSPLGAPADNGSGTNFTPPFPAYVSGHATFGGAIFEVLRQFYGTDQIPFTFISDELNGKTVDQFGFPREVRPRHFDTLSQAEEENGQSRIYLGIHWSFDKTRGIHEGNQIADFAFENFLRVNPNQQRFVVGADSGGGPRVRVMGTGNQTLFDFYAFDPSFSGGVRVAQGDVNGDGVPDIIAATGAGISSQVKVFDGTNQTLLTTFSPFESQFKGGCYVSSGDVNGDGFDDVIVAAGESGGPRVLVYSGQNGQVIRNFFAFDQNFRGGVRIASGDIDGNQIDDSVASPGEGGGPVVRVFQGDTGVMIREFLAYDQNFRGGIYLAVGDCDGDGIDNVITGAGQGGAPHVVVYDSQFHPVQSYFAFGPNSTSSRNGVRVGCMDFDGDGRIELLTASGPGEMSIVECTAIDQSQNFERLNVFENGFLGGVLI